MTTLFLSSLTPSLSGVEENVLIKVLVVENDNSMTDMIRIHLETKGFEVFPASSGEEGIEKIRQTNPDVVILDLLSGELDGWQICKEIRKFSRVPILVLSAVSKPDLVAQALDGGADDYLLKPLPSSVLVAHLHKLTRRARAERDGARMELDYLYNPATFGFQDLSKSENSIS